MAVRLNIEVSDIAATLLSGFTHIKVYRSSEEDAGFSEITTSSKMITLVPDQDEYEFVDVSGTSMHWYRVTFYDPNTPSESSFSASFTGEYYDSNFSATYPEEGVFTESDRFIISRIRSLTGDAKDLTRDYVSATTGMSNVSSDGFSYAFSNPKGWPLKVTLDDDSYTTLEDPVVNGYQFITFSGSTIDASSTLDLWYYHFRYSDSEILFTFNSQSPPYPLEADQVPFELSLITTAIDLLSAELRGSSSSSGVEVDIFEEIRINPKVGLDSRYNDLSLLIKRRDEIIDAILKDGIDDDLYGVLID